jgi:hypothetical protein
VYITTCIVRSLSLLPSNFGGGSIFTCETTTPSFFAIVEFRLILCTVGNFLLDAARRLKANRAVVVAMLTYGENAGDQFAALMDGNAETLRDQLAADLDTIEQEEDEMAAMLEILQQLAHDEAQVWLHPLAKFQHFQPLAQGQRLVPCLRHDHRFHQCHPSPWLLRRFRQSLCTQVKRARKYQQL